MHVVLSRGKQYLKVALMHEEYAQAHYFVSKQWNSTNIKNESCQIFLETLLTS